MTGYAGATLVPSPNCGGLGDASHKTHIIIHGTAGGSSASGIAAWFASTQNQSNPANRTSAHYVVGLQGSVYQCVDELEAAWGNGYISGLIKADGSGVGLPVVGDGMYRDPWWSDALNPNLITISIEHVKASSDNSDLLTPLQQTASFRLIKDICTRLGIPTRPADASGGITGHFSIDALNRARCPGPYPWAALFAYLNESEQAVLTIEQVSNYYSASSDGKYWQCRYAYNAATNQMAPSTSGAIIGNAMLDFYKSYGSGLQGLTNLGMPLTNEIGVGNGATIQHFECGTLCYDPGHKVFNPPGAGAVYLLPLGTGVMLSDPRYGPLLQTSQTAASTINTLQGQLSGLQTKISQIRTLVS